MTATALVTGSGTRVDDVARAIERRGVEVLRFDRGGDLARALAPGSLDYYVQLPGDGATPGDTPLGALASLLGRGLMSRVDEVDALLSKLATHCAVVLVSGDSHAPRFLLQMLADAITSDLSPSLVRTRVLGDQHSAEQIAQVTMANGPNRAALVDSYASRAPEMSYDDWRLECLFETGPEA